MLFHSYISLKHEWDFSECQEKLVLDAFGIMIFERAIVRFHFAPVVLLIWCPSIFCSLYFPQILDVIEHHWKANGSTQPN